MKKDRKLLADKMKTSDFNLTTNNETLLKLSMLKTQKAKPIIPPIEVSQVKTLE